MKKVLILIAILFATVVNAQEYNRWAISGEYGNQMVGDKTALSDKNFSHFGLGIRYNINEIIGIGLTGGYDLTSLVEELDEGTLSTPYDFEYGRINIEGYLNAFKVVDLYSKKWTVLFHGGPGVGFIKGYGPEYGINRETVLNLRGGASLLYKLSKRVVLYGDFSLASNIEQKMKFDGSDIITNSGMSSNISNISVGLTFYLGGKSKEHADWYVTPSTQPLQIIVGKDGKDGKNGKDGKDCECDVTPSEFIFFDHDEDIPSDIDGQGYKNTIFKTFKYLIDDPDRILIIRGYASATNSSDEYNLNLSNRRAKEITKKFVAMGISSDRIKVEYFGKDKKYNTEFVHDVARRVELIVKK